MKHNIIRIIIIVVLLAVAVVLGIIAFKPAAEPNLVPIKPVKTPEIVDIEIAQTPSPEPPAPTIEVLPEETPVIEEVTENVEESYTPSKKKDTNTAFFLIINDEKVNIAYGVEESILKKTPGWLENSAEPGEEGVCVVYGHRNRNHLRALKGVEIGDTITVETADNSYAYVVESIRIMDADDELTIPTTDGKQLMLSTCYPFHYSGRAPQKYIVTAVSS